MSEPLNISWQEFHRASVELAKLCLPLNCTKIVAIARGGLIPAGIIARELNIKLVDTVCINSYTGQDQGEMHILKQLDAAIENQGEGLLVVDDLVDTGKTAEVIRKMLPKAKIAVVYAKPQGEPFCDLYALKAEQNTWLNFPWDTGIQFTEPLVKE